MGCDQYSQVQEFGEEVFYDSREDVQSVFDSCPGSPGSPKSNLDLNLLNWVSGVWTQNPVSVQKRRESFTKLMCLDPNDNLGDEIKIVEETNFSSSFSSSISSLSTESSSLSDERISEEDLSCSIKNLDDGTTFVFSELSNDGTLTSLREIGTNREVTLSEFEKNFSSSTFIKELMKRQEEKLEKPKMKSEKNSMNKRSVGWLKRLGVSACIVDREEDDISTPSSSDCDQSTSGRPFERVKVRAYKKKSKELSAVYGEQVIKAHDGAILTLKFSPDGRYLASGGEDGVVRIWHVVLCERNGENEILIEDSNCVYFGVNVNSELAPLDPNNHNCDKEKKGRGKFGKKSTASACVVVPPNVFRIFEEPLHEFLGHNGEVLDIAWSKDKVRFLT
jgi:WD40 repeat protein